MASYISAEPRGAPTPLRLYNDVMFSGILDPSKPRSLHPLIPFSLIPPPTFFLLELFVQGAIPFSLIPPPTFFLLELFVQGAIPFSLIPPPTFFLLELYVKGATTPQFPDDVIIFLKKCAVARPAGATNISIFL